MGETSKSPRTVAPTVIRIGERKLSRYAHRFAPKSYTHPSFGNITPPLQPRQKTSRAIIWPDLYQSALNNIHSHEDSNQPIKQSRADQFFRNWSGNRTVYSAALPRTRFVSGQRSKVKIRECPSKNETA